MKKIVVKKPILNAETKQEAGKLRKENELTGTSRGFNPLTQKKSKDINSLIPGNEYPLMLEPKEFVLDKKRKIILSVKRAGDYGLVCLDVRQYSTTEEYTGFTKKGVNMPIEFIHDLIEQLCQIELECERNNLSND